MTLRPTVSLLVCVAAAGIAVGALTLDPGTGAAPAGGASGTLTIRDFAFSAASAAPGASVTVTNADGAPHTVTAPDGAFDTGTVDPGDTTAIRAPSAPGTYPFSCAIHPSMTGTLTVG